MELLNELSQIQLKAKAAAPAMAAGSFGAPSPQQGYVPPPPAQQAYAPPQVAQPAAPSAPAVQPLAAQPPPTMAQPPAPAVVQPAAAAVPGMVGGKEVIQGFNNRDEIGGWLAQAFPYGILIFIAICSRWSAVEMGAVE